MWDRFSPIYTFHFPQSIFTTLDSIFYSGRIPTLFCSFLFPRIFPCPKTEPSVSTACPFCQLAIMPTCSNSRSTIKLSNDRPTSDISQSTTPMDLWSSILSGKDSKTDPPYIHPMAKRSNLSDQSLEICTESLGSETGSDGFSSDEFGSDPPRRSSTTLKMKNSGHSKRAALPPPLPSQSIQMRCHRHDGRLVMEAVTVAPFQSCFRAQRQDGRLMLTFSDHKPSDGEIVIQETNGVADRDDDVGGQDDDAAEVTSSAGVSLKPYVYEYLRNKLQPTLLLMLKETTALPILSTHI